MVSKQNLVEEEKNDSWIYNTHLLSSFRNMISLPKRPLSDGQIKEQILQKEILNLLFLFGSRYVEVCKWNNSLKDLQRIALYNTFVRSIVVRINYNSNWKECVTEVVYV